MTELEVKLVKVDNWGIFFLQRLKHFFNRTDYCDLTLQFQDNAQLKVHRLVLSACTEYFELLERTCEMYEDYLVMPDDLQADVVVPIVNFMYTGQLEFRMDLLERLYQTSQIMNMSVLTKLLDAHRNQVVKPAISYNNKRSYSKSKESTRSKQPQVAASSHSSNKRPYSKAFGNPITHQSKENKKSLIIQKSESVALNTISETVTLNTNNGISPPYQSPNLNTAITPLSRKGTLRDPRPTRYELPEELDTDNIFDNSFTNISYTSQPLMVHPDTTKQYQRKKAALFGEASGSHKIGGGTSTLDIIECKKIPKKEDIFDDHNQSEINDDLEMFQIKDQQSPNISNQLFDKIVDQPAGPKVTIETKDNKQASNIDHAKIISEVLKKYPHLVKSNKNIKLKILNTPTPTTSNKSRPKKQRNLPPQYFHEKEPADSTYETDVLDSKEAARLIALGAENVKGPWICLICGTPGRALHFTSYYKFRRHLVEIHNEKPVSNMCEYCGLKSFKRNYLLHHLLTKHGVPPPPQYNFPKCNVCSYVALTEGLLVKHKLTHSDHKNFQCNICPASFNTSNQLLTHIQNTGHKYCADRKTNLQCIYCMRVFSRESNLYAHLKTYHKQSAKSDGIIDDSEEEDQKVEGITMIKYEPPNYETEYEDTETQYQIQPDGKIELVTNKQRRPTVSAATITKQKILNSGFEIPAVKPAQHRKQSPKNVAPIQTVETENEEIVMIDNNEYIIRNNRLIPKKRGGSTYEMIVPDPNETLTPSTSLNYSNIQDPLSGDSLNEQKMMIKKTANINQPIQIVVSNEEEYKALMNSNHSIIFDDGDANKTLTVLSTPHDAEINTLDLDSAQSNDMMIIQDNYPMSEALPGDNSNIVVVYSHAVDEENKQYQLITSQDISGQFVQSSAVITQSFVTPTTATSVITGTEEIHTQMAEVWQNTVHENQEAQLAEIQQMEIVEPAEITPVEQTNVIPFENTEMVHAADVEIQSSNAEVPPAEKTELSSLEPSTENNDELPEVNLRIETSQADTEVNNQTNDAETTLQPNENIITEHVCLTTEPTVETVEAHNVSSTPMDIDTPTESAEYIVKSVDSTQHETLLHNSTNTETEKHFVNEEELSVITEQTTKANGAEESNPMEERQEMAQIAENTEDEAGIVEEEEISIKQDNTATVTATESTTKNTIPEETKEQIQSLTSEWSEDEYDTEMQVQTEENIEKDSQDNNSEIESQEVEESIENIQQEMEKQVCEVAESCVTEDSTIENLQQEPISAVPVAPAAKISSLLNDWDENDSQEGNDSTNGTENESPAAETAEVVNEMKEANNITKPDMIDTKKDDKIKSLVSDWDDEDEDGKNEDLSA